MPGSETLRQAGIEKVYSLSPGPERTQTTESQKQTLSSTEAQKFPNQQPLIFTVTMRIKC